MSVNSNPIKEKSDAESDMKSVTESDFSGNATLEKPDNKSRDEDKPPSEENPPSDDKPPSEEKPAPAEKPPLPTNKTSAAKRRGLPKFAMAVAAFRMNKKEREEEEDFRILKQTAETKKRINEAKETSGILADDAWVPVWESFLLCATLYFEVIVTLNDIYGNWIPEVNIPLDLIGCGLFCVDTVVRVFMARSDVRDASKERRLWRLALWFCCDFLSAPPWHLVAHAAGYSVYRDALYHLPLLRIFRVVTYFEQVNPDAISAKYVYVYYQIVPMIQLLFWTLWFLHFFVICRLALIGDRRYETDSYNIAAYYVLYTVTTVGYGDIEVQSTGERSFACFLFVFGAFANAGIIGVWLTLKKCVLVKDEQKQNKTGKLSKMMQAHDIKSERKARMMETLAVMKYFNIPIALQHEVLAFQNHILQHNVGSSYAKIINGLPVSMQEHIGLYVRIKFISAVEMFQSACVDCKVCLAEGLKNVVYAPGDYIIRSGDVGMEMFFMGHGYADVLSPEGSHLATIKKGGFFGEIALLIETLRTASIRALTYCDLFRLDRAHFHRILDGFPEFNAVIQQEIESRKSKIALQKHETKDKEEEVKEDDNNNNNNNTNNNTNNTNTNNNIATSHEMQHVEVEEGTPDVDQERSSPLRQAPGLLLTPRIDSSDEDTLATSLRVLRENTGLRDRKESQAASSSCDHPSRALSPNPRFRQVGTDREEYSDLNSGVPSSVLRSLRRSIVETAYSDNHNLWSEDVIHPGRRRGSNVTGGGGNGGGSSFLELKDILSQISTAVSGVESRITTLEAAQSAKNTQEVHLKIPNVPSPTMRLRSTIRDRIIRQNKKEPKKKE